MAISVHLADDQTMCREGLAAILGSREGVEVVGQSSAGHDTVAVVGQSKPDVVIMQADAWSREAKEVLMGIRSVSPGSRIVVLTTFDDPHNLQAIWTWGVNACVHKNSPSEELLATIDTLSRKSGGANAVVSLPRSFPRRLRGGFAGTLSKRETEVLMLAARGLGNREIASHLNLAEDTIKSHLGNVYGKLGVNSRSEAVRKALAERWIGLHEITADASNG